MYSISKETLENMLLLSGLRHYSFLITEENYVVTADQLNLMVHGMSESPFGLVTEALSAIKKVEPMPETTGETEVINNNNMEN